MTRAKPGRVEDVSAASLEQLGRQLDSAASSVRESLEMLQEISPPWRSLERLAESWEAAGEPLQGDEDGPAAASATLRLCAKQLRETCQQWAAQ